MRRVRDRAFACRYFVGHGIDIGAGHDCLAKQAEHFPKMLSCKRWDVEDGDAQYMANAQDSAFDFVHSSHCLEHLRDPAVALFHWLRLLKPGGYLVCVVPDEDMYEQGFWPPRFNHDHKLTFTTWKRASWSPVSYSVSDVVRFDDAELIKIESLHCTYDWSVQPGVDQTLGMADAAIEFVVRKRQDCETVARGRVLTAR
jgi:SAM-dependent methyltransferase